MEQKLAFLLPLDMAQEHVPNLHLCKAHWTTKKGKASGRPLGDLSNVDGTPIVIVPGPGSRSYRVPTLPDPTGYYYCTLQLGCRIVVAICSVHLEVKLASSIDTCN